MIWKNIREGRVPKNPSLNTAIRESIFGDMDPSSYGPSSVFSMPEVGNTARTSSTNKAAFS